MTDHTGERGRAKFRITTAWCSEGGENPWLVSAYDEYTEDAWNGMPDFFTEAIAKTTGERRIIEVYVDYDAIEERFSAVDVVGHVGSSEAQP